MMANKNIVLVFGRICSGKGTYSAPFITSGFHHITTSDVVRHLSGVHTRDKLQHTKDLDLAIGDQMVEIISEHDKVIIDGIRQTRIVDKIVDAYGMDNIRMVWLDVPTHIREQRFLDRGAAKDDQTFNDAERGDVNLGIDEVEEKFKPHCEVIKHYCEKCRGDRYIMYGCCSGHMCGCMGQPYAYHPCEECNFDGTADIPESISSWEGFEYLEYYPNIAK